MRFGVAGIIAVAIPALEIVGIYQIGVRIGLGWTLVWLLAGVVAGMKIIRQEHAAFMPNVRQAVAQGEAPFAVMWASGRRFLAGVLLIIPGPVSDFVALLLLLWPGTRLTPAGPNRAEPNASEAHRYRRSDQFDRQGEVIEGDYRRED